MTRYWRPAKPQKSSGRGLKTDSRTSAWKSFCRWLPMPHSQRTGKKPLHETSSMPMNMDQSEKQNGSPRANEQSALSHSGDAGSDEARDREAGELTRGSGRILIMDDEEIIRDVAGRVLRAAGYDVECATEGSEAVELYRKTAEEGRPFDVVILDVTVPGGAGGKETVKRLLEINQSVKAIVS